MDEQALIDREREQTKAKMSTAQAELTTQKELWTRAKVEWAPRALESGASQALICLVDLPP